ncbi:MAG: M48 family metallopeptidase [Bacteroidales bacterium]|nr:M48 family metallopeptidase [Bacteroidales bacterium]
MDIIIFWIIIGVLMFDYIFERLLNFLNSKNRLAQIPPEVSDIYDEAEYSKQQKYDNAKSKINFYSSTFSILLILGMLLFKGFAYIDSLVYSYFDSTVNHIFPALIFFGILFLGSDILSLPFEVYNTFVIEEKFGFNKTTRKTFIFDKLKSLLITILLGGGILYLLLWLITFFESNFWIYAWIALSGIMVFFTMFYSSIIVPLFNKQTPIEEGELKDAIYEFASKVGFTLTNIYVIDGSKRSTKANAYFTGLGSKKRIVLYDTLIQELTTEEIVAVLAHEIGHYKKKHTVQMITASLLQTGILLFLFGLFLSEPSLTEALGVQYETGKYHIALFVFSVLYSPFSFIIGTIINMLSRKNEYEADEFAKTSFSGKHLQSALKKLVKKNLSNLTPHPWYVFFYYSHPPIYNRIKALLS